MTDPLVIRYILAMDSEALEDMSVYQGFSHGWDSLPWESRALWRRDMLQ